MTEQLNQVYAYLLKIEEASRKDVTGIQFAFEAGGYAKAAMAICESALNWPNHSNVEVQAKRKTGFYFGATMEKPPKDSIIWVCRKAEIFNPYGFYSEQWKDTQYQNALLDEGFIFFHKETCRNYASYLNSLSNEE